MSRSFARTKAFATFTLVLIGALVSLVHAPATSAKPGGDNSAATINGVFGDSCRDLTVQSSKDISHVEIHYVDGRVVKDEDTTSPDLSVDGGPGDEIDFAIVKSGTTSQSFTCAGSSDPPTAVLEIKTPDVCSTFDDGLVSCDGRIARTSWMHAFVPDEGFGIVTFFCDWPDDPTCVLHRMPCDIEDFYSLCHVTYSFRGTSSTDPDGDIVSWSIDFGDGTSTGGDWATNPPTEVPHEYHRHHCPTCSFAPAILTVTDSAGQASSDALLPLHQYPD